MVKESKKHYGIYFNRDDPILLKLDEIDGVSEKLKVIVEDYFNGKLAYEFNQDDFDKKIKKQRYLKLCLENWSLMKHTHIAEEAQEIILGIKDIEEPSVNQVFKSESMALTQTQPKTGFHSDSSMCYDCGHPHHTEEPQTCGRFGCYCGTRS